MSEPDLKPLMAALTGQALEVNERSDAMTPQCTDNRPSDDVATNAPSVDPDLLFPHPGMTHPISGKDAWELCSPFVGLVHSPRHISRLDFDLFERAIDAWWHLLRSTRIAEERLSCERMIKALGLADGLDQHRRGAELASENVERAVAQRRVRAQARYEREEAARIDAWRDFRSEL